MKKKFVLVLILWFSVLLSSQAFTQQCLPVTGTYQDATALSNFWGLSYPVCRVFNIGNAFADRFNGVIGVDQEFFEGVAYYHGSWAPTGILAHEWGHMVQGNVPPGPAAELQADCLAGVFFAGASLPPKYITQFASVTWHSGSDFYTSHATRSLRIEAMRRGYNNYWGQSGYALLELCPFSPY